MKILQLFWPFTLLPNFRGKVRFLRMIVQLFGIGKKRTILETRLVRPIPFKARLDIHCKHELMAYLMGGYEFDTVNFLINLYDKKGYFLDIGANIGLISIPFTLKTYADTTTIIPSPITICFEAINENCKALKHNIKINDLQNAIKIFCLGLGDTEKVVDIQIEDNLRDGEGTGTANILPVDSNYECERIPLKIKTLDNLMDSGELAQNCSLVKIDTDGYDLFILKGAKLLLTESRPLIYGEFSAHCLGWHGQTVIDVIEYMKSFKYCVYSKKLNVYQFESNIDVNSYTSDLLLVPEEKAAQLAWCIR